VIGYLFDIDGTLVRAGGAGLRSLAAVMAERYGVGDAGRGVVAAGRTDGAIVDEMVRTALGRAPVVGEVDAILADYLARLGTALATSQWTLPDADRVLTWLGARADVRLGVATGNVAAGAELKLRCADLARHFSFGGYGCDSIVRSELVARAIVRGGFGATDVVVVVGDTVHDVAAAHACGARCVAVTTGGNDRATLEAAGADVVFDGLAAIPDWHLQQFG
jgi:phosphoglycolate phosphatase